jgi:predicted CoA-binding protein
MSDASEKTVAAKLLLKPGHNVFPINSPEAYEQVIGHLPRGTRIVTEKSELPVDLVHMFATNKKELNKLIPKAIAAVRPDGLLWIAYPRVSTGTYDISREAVHEALHTQGWKPVTQISMDDVWTAIRGRPAAQDAKPDL